MSLYFTCGCFTLLASLPKAIYRFPIHRQLNSLSVLSSPTKYLLFYFYCSSFIVLFLLLYANQLKTIIFIIIFRFSLSQWNCRSVYNSHKCSRSNRNQMNGIFMYVFRGERRTTSFILLSFGSSRCPLAARALSHERKKGKFVSMWPAMYGNDI